MPKETDKKIPVKQAKSKVEYIQPWQWKKGQSGNPKGRPKGKTMKEYAKEMLECQTEKERQDFLHGLPKAVIWEMAEGRPDTKGMIGIGADKESLSVLTEFFRGVANKKTK